MLTKLIEINQIINQKFWKPDFALKKISSSMMDYLRKTLLRGMEEGWKQQDYLITEKWL